MSRDQRARGGDQAMARMLPDLSQALLAAAERQATSRQELERIRAVTAASLEATGASILTRTGGLTRAAGSLPNARVYGLQRTSAP